MQPPTCGTLLELAVFWVLVATVCVQVTPIKDPGYIRLKDLLDVIRRQEDVKGHDVHVNTQHGELRGKRREGYPGAGGVTSTVDWFLGVPYASPPTGNFRFKAPGALKSWTGVRNATRFGWPCPQDESYMYTDKDVQNEDCLTLNIYSPFKADDPDAHYPVFVFFHGGSYRVGAGSVYLGHVLAQYGVVVVTVNYRLGFLGFICARDENLPGNYGIMDQIESLRWIKDNIRDFRGDPGRVTISGNSAGGSSVGLLTISPPAAGLFQQVVVQSGSILGFWAAHNESVNLRAQTNEIADLMGCKRSNTADMAECLKRVPWQKIPSNSKFPRYSPTNTNLKPCLDDDVMPRMPRDLLADGQVHVTAAMLGVVDNEWARNTGWLFSELQASRPDIDQETNDGIVRSSFEQIVDHVITSRFGWDQTVAEAVKYEYTNWTATQDPVENRQQYIHFMTDYGLVAPTVELARMYRERDVPVFFYDFDHKSDEDRNGPSWWKSYHSVELNFMFGAPFYGLQLDGLTEQNYTPVDEDVSRKAMLMWSNFIRTGNPSSPAPMTRQAENATSSTPEWVPFTLDSSEYMYISSTVTEMRDHFRVDRMAFWNNFIPAMRGSLSVHFQAAAAAFKTEMLVFVATTVVLFILLIIALVYILCNHSSRRPKT